MSLSCEVSKAPVLQDIPVLTLHGEVNSETASLLDESLAAIMGAKRADLVVELAEVTYVSSAGWRTFLKWARHNQGSIRFIGMQPMVRDVFELLGFENVFATHDSLGDALRAVKPAPSR